MKQLNQKLVSAPTSNPSTNNIDTILTTILQQIQSLKCKEGQTDKSDFHEMAMCLTAQILSATLKADEAMLLSALYHTFLHMIKAESNNYPSLSLAKDKSVPSRRWVLSRLHSLFGETLTMVCVHDRYGTLLFRTKWDLVKTVTIALGKGWKYASPLGDCGASTSVREVSQPCGNDTSLSVVAGNTTDISEEITSVGLHLNGLVHKQVITCFQNIPQRYTSFDVATHTEMADPVLLKFIEQVKQSVRSKRRSLFENESEVSQTKRMRKPLTSGTSEDFQSHWSCSIIAHKSTFSYTGRSVTESSWHFTRD